MNTGDGAEMAAQKKERNGSDEDGESWGWKEDEVTVGKGCARRGD